MLIIIIMMKIIPHILTKNLINIQITNDFIVFIDWLGIVASKNM